MKTKIYIAGVVGLIFCGPAYAMTCAEAGFIAGVSCTCDAILSTDVDCSIQCIVGSDALTKCTLQDVAGVCTCSPKGGTLDPEPLSCPSECPQETWTNTGGSLLQTAYEARCVKYKCEYRCAAGYYGIPTSSLSGCTACPKDTGGALIVTSAAGATSITECYIPSGGTFSDDTGGGTLSDNCYYTN